MRDPAGGQLTIEVTVSLTSLAASFTASIALFITFFALLPTLRFPVRRRFAPVDFLFAPPVLRAGAFARAFDLRAVDFRPVRFAEDFRDADERFAVFLAADFFAADFFAPLLRLDPFALAERFAVLLLAFRVTRFLPGRFFDEPFFAVAIRNPSPLAAFV